MANSLKGEVPLKIGDKVHTLKLSYNQLCVAERAMEGVKAPQIIAEAGTGSFTATRALLWAALRHSLPEITIDEVGDMIQDLGMEKAVDAITEAFAAAFGKKEEGPENP